MNQDNIITPNNYNIQTGQTTPIPQTPIASPANSPDPEPSKKSSIIPIILTVFFAITSIVCVVVIISMQSQIGSLKTENDSLARKLSAATTSFFEPANWGIKFTYPEGMTNLEYEKLNDSYDTIIITSITKDGVTYDIDVCGGDSNYTSKQPFYFGLITRQKPTSNTNMTEELQQFLTIDGIEYYYSINGSGCQSDANNTDYLIGENIFQDLIDNLNTN